MANEENIRKVIDMIKDEQNFFDMGSWQKGFREGKKYPENVCGTPSCIGGWAEAIISHELGASQDIMLGDMKDKVIADWLGLSEEDCHDLFFPGSYCQEAYDATRGEAIAHLESIIEGGGVNWISFVKPVEVD